MTDVVYIDSGLGENAVQALGLRLQWSSEGLITCSFAVQVDVSVNGYQSIVRVESDGTTVFRGRVASVRRVSARGVKQVTARCWKSWLSEVPLINRSLQYYGTGDSYNVRHARVRYSYAIEAKDSARLPVWSVGAMIQDMLNGVSAGLGGDNLPVVTNIVPETVCSAWRWQYSTPAEPAWDSSTYAQVKAWIAAVTGSSSTSAWKPLTIVPWAVTFDGESVLGAITTLMRQYYPGWRWWYNPGTNSLQVLDPYDETTNAPIEYDCNTSERIYLDDVEPLVSNSYTRVIVEGRSTTDESIPASAKFAKGFVDQSAAFKSTTRVRHDFWRPPGSAPPYNEDSPVNVTITTTTYNGVDADSYVFVLSKDQQSGFAFKSAEESIPSREYTPTGVEGGTYGKDARWRYTYPAAAPWYSGEAYDSYGVKRTLVVVDDTVGDKVYTTDPETGEPAYVDRSAQGQALAQRVHALMSRLRYSGTLRVAGSAAAVNPLLRVKVKNHPELGTLTFSPHQIEYDSATGMISYALGDDRWNAVEEMQMINGLIRRTEGQRGRRLGLGGVGGGRNGGGGGITGIIFGGSGGGLPET